MFAMKLVSIVALLFVVISNVGKVFQTLLPLTLRNIHCTRYTQLDKYIWRRFLGCITAMPPYLLCKKAFRH